MTRQARNKRAPAVWLGAGIVLVVAVVAAGFLGSRATAPARRAEAPSITGEASSIPPTTIVYLTVPRTSALDPTQPGSTEPPPTTMNEQVAAPTVTQLDPTGPAASGAPSARSNDGARTFTFPSASESTEYASSHHDYPAADMFASCGTPALAATDGVIEDVATTDEWDSTTDDPELRSGLFVALVDDQGVRYYASHLASVTVMPGQAVAEGEQIGTVGDTGNAAGTGCHIHFGLSPACLSGWQNRRGLTYPQPFLDDWRSGGERDPLEVIDALGCT